MKKVVDIGSELWYPSEVPPVRNLTETDTNLDNWTVKQPWKFLTIPAGLNLQEIIQKELTFKQ